MKSPINQPRRRLAKSNLNTCQFRLNDADFAELEQTASQEQRSLSYISTRRYQLGKQIEQIEQNEAQQH